MIRARRCAFDKGVKVEHRQWFSTVLGEPEQVGLSRGDRMEPGRLTGTGFCIRLLHDQSVR